MGALSNPTPPPRVECFLENQRSNANHPFYFKRRKVSAVRSYPRNCVATITAAALTDSECENCGSKSNISIPMNFKHRKFEAVRGFPPKCGPNFSAGVLNDTIEQSKADMDLVVSPKNMDLVVSPKNMDLVVSPKNMDLVVSPKKMDLVVSPKKMDLVMLPTNMENCDSKSNISLNFKHRKVDAVREFPPKCGASFSAGVLNDTIERSNTTMDLVTLPIAAVPIAAVPIAAVPMQDFFIDDGKVTSTDNTIRSLDDDVKELEESIADAKNFLNDLDVCTSVAETEQICDSISVIVISDDDEPTSNCENREESINLRIVGHEEPQGVKVAEALKVFAEYYVEIVKEQEKMKSKGERKFSSAHFEVAMRLKNEGKYVYNEWLFGHTPGVEIGDEFRFRAQLTVIGVHRQLISGIDHVSIHGKNYATSVVDSGRYENTTTTKDVLIYSGQGGNIKISDKSTDQKLEKGNLALMNSMEMGYPVRVIIKQKRLGCDPSVVYVYNGLYTVDDAWQERDHLDKLVFKFKLQRMPDQSKSHKKANEMSSIKKKALLLQSMVETPTKEVCVVDDISQGKEKIPIRAMNGVDENLPPNFTYVNSMVYQSWYRKVEPIGCDCVDGCSDFHQCTCVMKNGGELPYNENGCIVKATARIHECGPLCKCPPTCMNRISQHGPRYQLEIFKTKQKGWGVRSRDHIPSGGFVCEYIGEFLREKEADTRVGGDEYLFDVCKGHGGCGNGFSIDARVYGSIGRFFNHSCSPNMYAQKVIYDHDDHRMPCIVFYATEDIPPLKELCYHYNYKIDSVCDADGNVKTKECSCGSRKCTKRLY